MENYKAIATNHHHTDHDHFLKPKTVPSGKLTDTYILKWHNQGIISRKGEPAVLAYLVINGEKKLMAEEWYDNGFNYRKIRYDVNGNIIEDATYDQM